MGPTRLRPPAAAALVVLLALGSACSNGGSASPDPAAVARYGDPQTGTARLMADSTPRIDGFVDVTNSYPDPRDEVVGAAVLIDHRIAVAAARTDLRRRPVLVVYVDQAAARRAAAVHGPGTFVRDGAKVVHLPSGFSPHAVRTYHYAMGAGLG